MTRYESARDLFAQIGVDTEAALKTLAQIPISLHCWQGDDVLGFDGADSLSGGIQTTGNYPGRARTPQELMADIEKAVSLMPGRKRLNLHASYAFLGDDKGRIDRDAYEPRHFAPWVAFAKKLGLDGIDFNPTYFGHPLVKDGLTLSSPDPQVRAFWVRHGVICRRIAQYFADEMGTPSLVNVWIPDGLKDVPADRLSPRIRLRESLDAVFAEKLPGVIDAVESKVFGIGVESYTVGSNEFYQNYASSRGICCLLDNGHYHPTEVVSDKIPRCSRSTTRSRCTSRAACVGIPTTSCCTRTNWSRSPRRSCATRPSARCASAWIISTRRSTASAHGSRDSARWKRRCSPRCSCRTRNCALCRTTPNSASSCSPWKSRK